MRQAKAIIIGAGLSGLTAAYQLKKNGIEAILLEAQNRIGGRIYSVDSRNASGKVEMGATWLGEKHQELNRLMYELGIKRFEQYNKGKGVIEIMSFLPPQIVELPKDQEPYFRISGGSIALVNLLMTKIGADKVFTDHRVEKIIQKTDHYELGITNGQLFQAEYVISTVPQRLFTEKILIEPRLPSELLHVMSNINPWMHHSIKFTVEYPSAFWRNNKMAGMAMSQTGIVQEVQDHCSEDNTVSALMGFLAGRAHDMEAAEREKRVIQHLTRLFGHQAGQYIKYRELVWREEETLTPDYGKNLTFKYNFGNPIFQEPLFDGKLIISGTETAASFPGYMEGAVYSGIHAAEKIVKATKNKAEQISS